MDLLVSQLKAAIRRLLEAKGVRARVLDKMNRHGEVVIGVILEPPAPGTEARGAARPGDIAPPPVDGVTEVGAERTVETGHVEANSPGAKSHAR